MADEADGGARTRSPTQTDLARVARSLNAHGVRYAIIGGIAVIHHGFARATQDLDLLVDPSAANVAAIRRALAFLEDGAVLDVADDDVQRYQVVRVMDEICIDLLGEACGVRLEDVRDEIQIDPIEGVPVPFLSPAGLLATKDTWRPKDRMDREFLTALLAEEL